MNEVVRRVDMSPVVNECVCAWGWIYIANEVDKGVINYDIAIWSRIGCLRHDDTVAEDATTVVGQ